jgi:hypothetical protein
LRFLEPNGGLPIPLSLFRSSALILCLYHEFAPPLLRPIGKWRREYLLIRLAVGLIFFTRGILNFTDPKMGVER